MPLDRIQKLSVHLPLAGTVCRPDHLSVRFTPLMIVVSGSKQMNGRGCPSRPDGSQIVATLNLGPNSVSTVLPPDSIQNAHGRRRLVRDR